jgi:putative ABC transport system permease protein
MIFNPVFFLQTIILAIGQIWANKMRSFLTSLGIIIGVASVTSVVAALDGLRTVVLDEFEAFGASKLFIFPRRPPDAPRNLYPFERIRITLEEVRLIDEHCPSIRMLTPQTSFGATIRTIHWQNETINANVTGIWPTWHAIENRNIIAGRPFTQIDEENARRVCIINEELIRELRLSADPTGEFLLLNEQRFLIVGVVETHQPTIFVGPGSGSLEVLIPFSTATRMQSHHFGFHVIAQSFSPEASEEAKHEVEFVLRRARNLAPDEPNTFGIEAIDYYIEQFKALAAGITAIAGGIVAISLLVGGIGIMNIMLVSVSERTREIGLRKAVGARPSAILMQFLVEAIMLCFAGGLIGLLVAQVMVMGLASIPNAGLEAAAIPMWAVIMAFGFSAAVGIVFGMFPAIKAARLDPIDALRHE